MLRRVFKVGVPDEGLLVIVPTLNKVYLLPDSAPPVPDFVQDDEPGDETELLLQADASFDYPSVMFLLTTRCNLRCIYCYAQAGDADLTMPLSVAERAVDYVVGNALERGQKAWIRFHGGGEPTVAWDELVGIVNYANRRAPGAVEFSITTNGVLNPTQRQFLADHMAYVNLSMDGPPHLQNLQRPLASGGGSFERVIETARFFYDRGVKFGVRISVTGHSVAEMPDTVGFFGRNFPGIGVAVEPIDICGRCAQSGIDSYELPGFARLYLEARMEAEKYDLRLRYSSTDLRRVGLRYCGTSANNFIITPEGYVTACSRVCRLQDPGSELFVFGHYDRTAGRFVFDAEKHRYLQEFRVDNMPACRDCFAAWLCKGDCPMARYNYNSGDVLTGVSPRCEEIRHITLGLLLERLGVAR